MLQWLIIVLWCSRTECCLHQYIQESAWIVKVICKHRTVSRLKLQSKKLNWKWWQKIGQLFQRATLHHRPNSGCHREKVGCIWLKDPVSRSRRNLISALAHKLVPQRRNKLQDSSWRWGAQVKCSCPASAWSSTRLCHGDTPGEEEPGLWQRLHHKPLLMHFAGKPVLRSLPHINTCKKLKWDSATPQVSASTPS